MSNFWFNGGLRDNETISVCGVCERILIFEFKFKFIIVGRSK